MKLVNPKDGAEFTSPFKTHNEALAALKARIANKEWDELSTFPNSIAKSGEAWGTKNCSGCTPAQLYWLHKLAAEGARKLAAAGKFNLSKLVAMLTTAKSKSKLKSPAIVLQTKKGLEIRLSLAGAKSKYEGAVMISSKSFNGPYYGRVMPDGLFYQGRDFTPQVGDLLHAMANDPIAAAAAHGKLTGRCCFCNRPLEEDGSVATGYGPGCAKKFGLLSERRAIIRKVIRNHKKLEAEPAPKPKASGRIIIRRKIESC